MNKEEKYLKFYIDSDGNIDAINKFIKSEQIRLDEFNDVVTSYLKKLKNENKSKKSINKLYLEYCLKYGNNIRENTKVSKRKETEIIINIISNYINENKHNIKDYVINNNYDYNEFKKFINNSKKYYLTDREKNILKDFLKRENDFNKDNIDNVKNVVDKISDDLVGDIPFNILDYYINLGWDSKLLIYYLNNNKEVFSQFLIDNVRLYLKKYHIDSKVYKLNDFIDYIKSKNKTIDNKLMTNIIEYMNKNKFPYNYYLFKSIKEIKFSE